MDIIIRSSIYFSRSIQEHSDAAIVSENTEAM